MNVFREKKLLILGGAEVHCKVVRAAKEMGIHTIVIDNLDVAHSPAKQISDENYLIDIYDIDEIIKLCKEKKIDGVINTSLDPCQIPQAKICTQLGLPCYGTLDQYYTLTNKVAFKAICCKCGIDVIEDFSEDDVLNGKAIYPLFIKPVDSRGSRGQSICNNLQEALEGMKLAKSISTDGTVLIEQYLKEKQDFMLSYIVIDSVPHLVRICDRYGGFAEDGLDKVGALAMNPSKYSGMYMENVHSKILQLIKYIGIKNGPVFLQGFVDGDTVRFYDPGLRLPGGNYENLYKSIYSVDIIKMLIEYSLMGTISDSYGVLSEIGYDLKGGYAANLFPMMHSGKIGSIEGFEYIQNLSTIISAALRHNVGDYVEPTKTVAQRIGEFNIRTDSILEMKSVIRDIYNHLKVLDDQGIDLACSKLDIENLWIG